MAQSETSSTQAFIRSLSTTISGSGAAREALCCHTQEMVVQEQAGRRFQGGNPDEFSPTSPARWPRMPTARISGCAARCLRCGRRYGGAHLISIATGRNCPVRMRYSHGDPSADLRFSSRVAWLAYAVGLISPAAVRRTYASASPMSCRAGCRAAIPGEMDVRGQTPGADESVASGSTGATNTRPDHFPRALPAAPKNGVDTNPSRAAWAELPFIVQSYTTEKLADEAAIFWLPTASPARSRRSSNFLYAISPSTGYVHITSRRNLETPSKNIIALGNNSGSKTKFKRFDPYGYKWKTHPPLE